MGINPTNILRYALINNTTAISKVEYQFIPRRESVNGKPEEVRLSILSFIQLVPGRVKISTARVIKYFSSKSS